MILSIWVFFMLGDPTPTEPGIAYVQATASRFQHDYAPEATEQACAAEYAAKYPGHPVCECGWRRQEVTVMGA
jgi:hypothetical protein